MAETEVTEVEEQAAATFEEAFGAYMTANDAATTALDALSAATAAANTANGAVQVALKDLNPFVAPGSPVRTRFGTKLYYCQRSNESADTVVAEYADDSQIVDSTPAP